MSSSLAEQYTTATAVWIPDALSGRIEEYADICPGTTVAEFLKESGFDKKLIEAPTFVRLNSVALREDEFGAVINAGDVLTLDGHPGEIVTIITWIAWAVVAAASAYSLYLALTLDTGLDAADEESTNYNLSYRGNSERQGGPRRVAYGTMRIYPDVGAQSFTVYDNNGDQQLHQLFEFTEGFATISELQYDQTPITNFTDYETEIIPPGATSQLFPQEVYNVPGVSNIELTTTPSAEYVVCELGDVVTAVYIDIVAPEGMYAVNSAGSYYAHQVLVNIEWRLAGSTGAWGTIGVMIGTSWSPVRTTYKLGFDSASGRTAGRYEFRFSRTIADSGSSTVMETVQITGLRGFLPAQSVTTSTRVAVIIRKTDQLGGGSLLKFNGLCQRHLQSWKNSAWTSLEQTNSAVWAFCDALRSYYGGKRADRYIDLDYLETIADTQFDVFNGCFDTEGTLSDGLDKIAACMLGRAIELPGNVYTIRLDQANTMPSAMYTAANILDGSFSIELVYPGTETNDSVGVTFKNELQGYRDSRVLCVPDGSPGTNPAEVTMIGPTNGYHAAAMGFRIANESRYRRTMVSWETGIEGYLTTFGEVVRVMDYQVGRLSSNAGVSGEIMSWDGVDSITVAEDISAHTSGFVYLLALDGAPYGPYACTVSGQIITIPGAYNYTGLTFDDNLARPTFALGAAADFMLDVKVTEVEPSPGSGTYKIRGFFDNQNAYLYDNEPTPTTLDPPQDLYPIVSNVQAYLYGESDNPYVKLTWLGENADHYRVDVTIDGGSTWNIVTRRAPSSEWITAPPIEPAVQYRITGVSLFPGNIAYSPVISPSTYVLAVPPITGLAQLGDFSDAAAITWTPPRDKFKTWVFVVWNGKIQRSVVLDRTINTFYYSASDAISDDPDYTAAGVPTIKDGARSITFRLHTLANNGEFSADAAELTLVNGQVVSLQGVVITEQSADLNITYLLPDQRDFGGCAVYVSESSPFTPSSDTLMRRSNSNDITLAGILRPNSTYYVMLAGYDIWGFDSLRYSNEYRVDTSDDVLSGIISWENIIGDGRPDDFATLSGYASAVVDPRFDLSAARGDFGPYWTASGASIALSLTGGNDGGPGALITADGTTLRLHPGDGTRLPASSGTRFQVRARMKKSADMIATLEATEYDIHGEYISRYNVATAAGLTVGAYGEVEGVYTVLSDDCRSVLIGPAVGSYVTSGETLGIDDFNIWILAPAIGDNIAEYIDSDAIQTEQIQGGAVFVADVVDRAADVSFTNLTPGAAGAWSEWYVVSEYEVDFVGRKDGQPLIISYFRQDVLELQNTNASSIASCQMVMQLVREDGEVMREFTNDTVWGASFTMPSTPSTPRQYGGDLTFAPWLSPWHQEPRAENLVDLDPPNGLITYQLRFALKCPTALTALSYRAGSGRIIVQGGKA